MTDQPLPATNYHPAKPPTGLAAAIFGRIWALWAVLVFIVTLLVAVVPICITYLIPEPGGVKAFKVIARVWMSIFLYAIGCPIRVVGKEHYDPSKNYVVASNHSSLMDVPLLTPFFPGPNKTIAKKSFAQIPIFGWVYTRGSVLVDRKSDASRRKSYEDMKKVLQENLNMAIYPEGTRNRTGQPLKSFYDGAFRLAADCKKDIIPVVMKNTAKVLPPAKPFFLWPSRMEMHILPAIACDGKSAKELKEEVFGVMWNYIEAMGSK